MGHEKVKVVGIVGRVMMKGRKGKERKDGTVMGKARKHGGKGGLL